MDDQPRVVPNRRERRNRKYRPNLKSSPPWTTAPNALIYPDGAKNIVKLTEGVHKFEEDTRP